MSKDKLTICNRCGGNACYEQHIPNPDQNSNNKEVTTWLCFTCGFTTSTLMEKGSKVVKDLRETSPELYKDLLYIDQDNRVWSPSTLTLPGKGMVFIDGSNKDNWVWKAVKAIKITDEDRKQKQYPPDQEYKMDMVNAQTFGQREYMDALEAIQFFAVDL